jgi:three-Cys-motif partner protein
MGKKEEISDADDGFIAPVVGPWAEEKYRLVSMYAELFAKSMLGKWGERVYIDLYCGPGLVKERDSERIRDNSALRVLKNKTRFDRYILGDISEQNIKMIREQVEQFGMADKCDFLCGDAQETARQAVGLIQKRKTSSICFGVLDPYNTHDFKFDTVKVLNVLKIDLLVLIASFMDGSRNEIRYLDPESVRLEGFFSDPDWREKWKASRNKIFGEFIAKHFCEQVQGLGFLDSSNNIKLIRSISKNAPLYHLAFFSKSELGLKFWKESKKYSKDQLEMELE